MNMERLSNLDRDYYLQANEPSDAESCSSDEDPDVWLNGLMRVAEGRDMSLGDARPVSTAARGVSIKPEPRQQAKDFEADAEDALTAALAVHNQSWMSSLASTSKPTTGKPKSLALPAGKNSGKDEDQVDEAVGLKDTDGNSDDEFREQEGMTQPANEDLFYDPELDDLDQEWINKHRRGYVPKSDRGRPLPSSDAVLNCPCCMTSVCLDCQRHEVYKTQYRAMFVRNCQVNKEEKVCYPPSKKGQFRRRKRKANQEPEGYSSKKEGESGNPQDVTDLTSPEDIFNPVNCAVCRTQVGVMDSDHVYHFFNVLASH